MPKMTQDEARQEIVSEWRAWARGKSFKVNAGGTDEVAFFEHVKSTKPELLKFKGGGDKWELVHGWLLMTPLDSPNEKPRMTMPSAFLFLRRATYAFFVGSIIGGYGALFFAAMIRNLLFRPFCPGGRNMEDVLERSYDQYPEWTMAACSGGEDTFIFLGRILVCVGIPLGVWSAWSSWWNDYEGRNRREWSEQTPRQKIIGVLGAMVASPFVVMGGLLMMAPMALLLFGSG